MSSMASSIISSSSATVKVDKATSEYLSGPDWTLNIDICDTLNSNQMLVKDVVKAVKKRLQHKNPKIQLLALTLLETMIKNCGDYVHFQIAERNVVQEMVKIVMKKTDMNVRDKILTLIASWNEAFGGPRGRYPQYYTAYEELRHFGISFPKLSSDSAPIFTPPVTHPISRQPPQPGYGMPSTSSTRLDEAMASGDGLSLSSIRSMRYVLDLLADMLQAVDPHDRSVVKDEVIVDLVEQCRANQKNLMQMLNTAGDDEEILAQGIEVNDKMQIVLAKHDAIASGLPLTLAIEHFKTEESALNHEISPKSSEASSVITASTSNEKQPSAPELQEHKGVIDEGDEEEDEFTLLAQRHSKTGTGDVAPSETSPIAKNALVPVHSFAQVEIKDQDIIDLLGLTLSPSKQIPQTPQNQIHSTNQEMPYSNDIVYPQNQGLASNSYVTPWARTQPQMQNQEFQSQPQSTYVPHPSFQPTQPPQQPYIPPPWASTLGYYTGQNSVPRQPYAAGSNVQPMVSSNAQPWRNDSFHGETQVNNASPRSLAPNAGQKPFIPSYRLFEDLDVFGNSDGGRFKAGNNTASSSLLGSNNQSMLGGQK